MRSRWPQHRPSAPPPCATCWRRTAPRWPGCAACGRVGRVRRTTSPGIWERHVELGISVLMARAPGVPGAGWPMTRRRRRSSSAWASPAVLGEAPTVALVGTRAPTRYGIGVAAQLGADLSAAGVSVVSGLALGIDGAAHEGACGAGAPPIGVVAGGLDDPYPRRHARLWARVAAHGAVVSESPAGRAHREVALPRPQPAARRHERRRGRRREPASRRFSPHRRCGRGPWHPGRRRSRLHPQPDQ